MKRLITRAAVPLAALLLAACQTTTAPMTYPDSVAPVQLSAREMQIVQQELRRVMLSPTGTMFDDNMQAVGDASTVIVCGTLSGSTSVGRLHNVGYVVVLDYSAGPVRSEVIALGGNSTYDRRISNFCGELGMDV